MSVNRVILVGNLGKDPELRYTPSGAAVANFSIATTDRYKDKNGDIQEKTEWHNIVAWRQLAEICGKYLVKGKQAYIEGKLTTRSYEDREGVKKYVTEIVAENMQMLGSRGGDSGQGEPRQREQPQREQPQQDSGGGGYVEPQFNPDDDIPFAFPHEYREVK